MNENHITHYDSNSMNDTTNTVSGIAGDGFIMHDSPVRPETHLVPLAARFNAESAQIPSGKSAAGGYVTKKMLAIAIAISIVLSSLLGGFIGAMLPSKSDGDYQHLSLSTQEHSTDSPLSISEIVNKNADSVVEISTEVTQMTMFGEQTGQNAGSGVIVKQDGYIATNYHVIKGADAIVATLHNGKEYPAELVGYDEGNDIAVLKINAKDLKAATMGKSSSLNVGDMAVAIGNPLGQLGGTATSGIVSATDRNITLDNKELTLLQTDSAISPGNSGGGLFNGNGDLIGIVVAKGSGDAVEGLGFAIPIDVAAPIIDDIIDNGTITEKPAAGITITNVTENQLSSYDVSEPGVYINKVHGTNAQKAGLKAGDRIIAFNGQKIEGSADLIARIQRCKIGDEVTITVERNEKKVNATFALEAASQFTTS